MRRVMTGERVTAMISCVLAIAILAAMGTAQPSRSETADLVKLLESDLRFQLDLGWRQSPLELNQRRAELESVVAAWRKSPQSQRDRELMVAWLRDAMARSLPDRLERLPAAPEFSSRGGGARQGGTVSKPPAVVDVKAPSQPAPVVDAPRNNPPAPSTGSNTIAQKPVLAEAPSLAAPELQRPPIADKPAAIAASAPPVVVAAPADRAPPIDQSSYAEAQGTQPLAPQRATLTISEPFPTTSIDSRPAANPQRIVSAPSEAPTVVAASEFPTAPVEPAVAATSASAVKPQAVSQPVSQPVSSPVDKPVEVNLMELNARIGGYHDGLAELKAAVIGARRKPDAGELNRLVSKLESLAKHYQFVRLYYDSLSEREQQFVMEPRSMHSAVELVDERLVAFESDSDADFLDSLDAAATKNPFEERIEAVRQAIGD